MTPRLLAVIATAAMALGVAGSANAGGTRVKVCDFQEAYDCVLRVSSTARSSQNALIDPQKWLIVSTVGGRTGYAACPIRKVEVSVTGTGTQSGAGAKGRPSLHVESKVRSVKPYEQEPERTVGTVTSGASVTEILTRNFSPPGCKFIVEVSGFARQIPAARPGSRFLSTSVSISINTSMLA